MTNSESFCSAIVDARYRYIVYPEPYAKVLRIIEHIINKVNANLIEREAYHEAYEIMAGAWSQLSAEDCVQESFDV